MLIPHVVILSLLCGHCQAHPHASTSIEAWKARYLAMYDREIDGMGPAPGFKEERRAVIEATFDRLAALARG